ncbi:uncharacterized protein A4U43_C03F7900 [Asparagus officinalis]|uniref:Uncharacterized protein n=1 Tax=Asparagus officinalis TaxID=4686 RepID=A0A5P1F8C1_ASPOF|nr:uncharacterized protein LOC109833205 [Asparagus officinalis]ONK74575.1 uncharacterized protein A4U43_C03F7900 [Asparagus officinalis]
MTAEERWTSDRLARLRRAVDLKEIKQEKEAMEGFRAVEAAKVSWCRWRLGFGRGFARWVVDLGMRRRKAKEKRIRELAWFLEELFLGPLLRNTGQRSSRKMQQGKMKEANS